MFIYCLDFHDVRNREDCVIVEIIFENLLRDDFSYKYLSFSYESGGKRRDGMPRFQLCCDYIIEE